MTNYVNHKIILNNGHFNRFIEKVLDNKGLFNFDLIKPVPNNIPRNLIEHELLALAKHLSSLDLDEDVLDELLEPVALYIRPELIEDMSEQFEALDLEFQKRQALMALAYRDYKNLIAHGAIHHDSWKRNHWGSLEAEHPEVNGREITFFTAWSDVMPLISEWVKSESLSLEYYALEMGYHHWVTAAFKKGELIFVRRNQRSDLAELQQLLCANEEQLED